MMKNIFENPVFVFSFLVVDLLIFFGIYVFHNMFFKSFSLSGAALGGLYEIFWRFASLQIFIQAAFIFVSMKTGFSKDLMIFVSALLAFSIASVISFSSIWALLGLIEFSREAVGEGFAIAVSVFSALMVFRIVGQSRGQSS